MGLISLSERLSFQSKLDKSSIVIELHDNDPQPAYRIGSKDKR